MYIEEMSTSTTVQSIATVHQPSIVSPADLGGLQNMISEPTQGVCVWVHAGACGWCGCAWVRVGVRKCVCRCV